MCPQIECIIFSRLCIAGVGGDSMAMQAAQEVVRCEKQRSPFELAAQLTVASADGRPVTPIICVFETLLEHLRHSSAPPPPPPPFSLPGKGIMVVLGRPTPGPRSRASECRRCCILISCSPSKS